MVIHIREDARSVVDRLDRDLLHEFHCCFHQVCGLAQFLAATPFALANLLLLILFRNQAAIDLLEELDSIAQLVDSGGVLPIFGIGDRSVFLLHWHALAFLTNE